MATLTVSSTFTAAVNGFGMSGYWAWSDTATDAQQAANKSTVTVSLVVTKSSGSTTYSSTFGGSITIDGYTTSYSNESWSLTPTITVTIITASREVTHDANGSKSIVVSGNYGDQDPNPATRASWSSSAGTATIALNDFVRLPNTPGTPTIVRNGTSLSLTTAVSAPLSPVGPSISYEYQVRSSTDNGVTWSSWSATPITMVGAPDSATSITNLSLTTAYQYQTRAKSTEGPSNWSNSATAYPAPAFTNVDVNGNITTLPDSGTFSVAYTGTVVATNSTSISVSLGSLPNGLSTSSSTTSGTTTLTISGTPTVPGVFSAVFTATGPGGTAVSSIQSFSIGAAGPWVYTNASPTGVNVTNVVITTFNSSYNIAALTTGTHGITEANQPITISGITGTYASLNGDTSVYGIPSSTSLTILVPTSVTGSGSVTGTLKKYYSRGVPKVYNGTSWVNAFMRVYDPSYTDAAGSHWRPLS